MSSKGKGRRSAVAATNNGTLFSALLTDVLLDSDKRARLQAGACLLLLMCFFFTRINLVSAYGEVPPPVWLNEEDVEADGGNEVIDVEVQDMTGAAPEEAVHAGPYEDTFIISAYYSPLPGQARYVTGSYEGDIRLNGGGVRGADGTPVYPGMIAAPRTYAFGTKMSIPGVGTVAVHDRGGAIVASGVRGHAHDRLDVWMGYGDKGLQRALKWGKRTVPVLVYGVNDAITEFVELADYTENEHSPSVANEPISNTPERADLLVSGNGAPYAHAASENIVEVLAFANDMSLGSSGEEVRKLQEELANINLLGIEPTGFYGEVTAHAVFKFQQSRGLVANKGSFGAGVLGPKTRAALNNIVAARMRTEALVAANSGSGA